jgi:hypothetical protein
MSSSLKPAAMSWSTDSSFVVKVAASATSGNRSMAGPSMNVSSRTATCSAPPVGSGLL